MLPWLLISHPACPSQSLSSICYKMASPSLSCPRLISIMLVHHWMYRHPSTSQSGCSNPELILLQSPIVLFSTSADILNLLSQVPLASFYPTDNHWPVFPLLSSDILYGPGWPRFCPLPNLSGSLTPLPGQAPSPSEPPLSLFIFPRNTGSGAQRLHS